jgi:hemolysin III
VSRLAGREPPAAVADRPALRGWLHATAALPAAAAGALLAAHGGTTGRQVGLAIYGFSLTALFSVSAAFHRVRWSPAARRRMRRADHSTIFVAIAGTYTAVAAVALRGWARTAILLVVWLGATVGILLRQLWLDAPKWAVALPYVVVGWCAVIVLPQLWQGLGATSTLLVLAGGVCFSVGALVYARRRPDPWPRTFGYHEVFHALTVVGAVVQFTAIARVVAHGPA